MSAKPGTVHARVFSSLHYVGRAMDRAIVNAGNTPLEKEARRIARLALNVDWYDTESMARRVAETAALEVFKLKRRIEELEVYRNHAPRMQ